MAGGGEGPVDLRLRPPLGPFSLSPGRGGEGPVDLRLRPPPGPFSLSPGRQLGQHSHIARAAAEPNHDAGV